MTQAEVVARLGAGVLTLVCRYDRRMNPCGRAERHVSTISHRPSQGSPWTEFTACCLNCLPPKAEDTIHGYIREGVFRDPEEDERWCKARRRTSHSGSTTAAAGASGSEAGRTATRTRSADDSRR